MAFIPLCHGPTSMLPLLLNEVKLSVRVNNKESLVMSSIMSSLESSSIVL